MTIIPQVHRSLPQNLTPENLANYITTNQKEVINHVTKIPLTPEEVATLEHKSSAASRSIDRLKEVEEDFKHYIKKGTAFDGEKHLPQEIVIPPTKGVDALKSNREVADETIERGYNEDVTVIYMIPNPEDSQMVAVTIEGHEVTDYTRAMNQDEDKTYGKLFRKEGDQMKLIPTDEVSVNGDGTAKIKTKKKNEPFI